VREKLFFSLERSNPSSRIWGKWLKDKDGSAWKKGREHRLKVRENTLLFQ